MYVETPTPGASETNVLVRHSDDEGATWSEPVQVNEASLGTSHFMPRISIDQSTGQLGVTWWDTRNDPLNSSAQYFGAFSSDGGASFTRELPDQRRHLKRGLGAEPARADQGPGPRRLHRQRVRWRPPVGALGRQLQLDGRQPERRAERPEPLHGVRAGRIAAAVGHRRAPGAQLPRLVHIGARQRRRHRDRARGRRGDRLDQLQRRERRRRHRDRHRKRNGHGDRLGRRRHERELPGRRARAARRANRSLRPCSSTRFAPLLAPSLAPRRPRSRWARRRPQPPTRAIRSAAASPRGSRANSCGPVETAAVGPGTLTCSAADVAGNAASASLPYVVGYAVSVLSPVSRAGRARRQSCS